MYKATIEYRENTMELTDILYSYSAILLVAKVNKILEAYSEHWFALVKITIEKIEA